MKIDETKDPRNAEEWLREISYRLRTAAVDGYDLDQEKSLAEIADTIDDVLNRCHVVPISENPMQGIAILRQAKLSSSKAVKVIHEPFDLPAGYVMVEEIISWGETGFTCGIASDGSVSS